MIIQATQSDPALFPRRVDKILLVTGFLIFVFGQVLLNRGQDFVAAQQPVDFAHWCLLIGVVLFLPFVGRLPRRNIHLLTIPLMLAGITAVIGMCVLDFIFWSLPPGDLARDFYRHVSAEPSIWQVFITIGPGWVFGVAIALPSLSYWHVSRLGTGLVVFGAIFLGATGRDLIVPGYLIVTLGYVLCFRWLRAESR